MAMRTISRLCERRLLQMLEISPAVLLVGARQIGKSFLARKVAAGFPSVFYDLEDPADLKKLDDPGTELRSHPGKMIVIDEVQHKPDLFGLLRVIIDEERREGAATGKFLLLGSVSGKLQRQTESLTGRIMEARVHSVDLLELLASGYPNGFLDGDKFRPATAAETVGWAMQFLRSRGGYPESILADSEQESMEWRRAYLLNSIRKDTANSRLRVSEKSFVELLRLIADKQGSATAVKVFADDLQLDHRTVTTMLSVLEQMMLIFRLPAHAAVKQQLRKRCKYYLCDSGMHNCLVRWGTDGQRRAVSAAMQGANWEGFVIQNIMAVLPEGWYCSYSREVRRKASRKEPGLEVDLVIQKPGYAAGAWAVEIKSGDDPDTAGLRRAAGPLRPERSFVVHGGTAKYHDRNGIRVISLLDMMNEIRAHDSAPEYRAAITPGRQQASMKYRAVMWALDHERPDINMYRSEFVDDFSAAAATACRQASGPADREARAVWVKRRDELLSWLDAESLRQPAGEGARQWRRHLYSALQLVAGLRSPRLADMNREGYNFYGEFSGLCCYDLFVCVTAVLLKNGCHQEVQRLVEHCHLVERPDAFVLLLLGGDAG